MDELPGSALAEALEVDRHPERCAEAEKRVFVGNMSGAVGTLSSFGPQGLEVQRRTLEKLGLGVPRICWDSTHDRIDVLSARDHDVLLAVVDVGARSSHGWKIPRGP